MKIINLINSVYQEAQFPTPENDRNNKNNPLNSNFKKKEFKELWNRINRKAIYNVAFDSSELIDKCVSHLDEELQVAPLQYTVKRGEQRDNISYGQIKSGEGFEVRASSTESNKTSIHSGVKYDLIGKIAENNQLTRKTVAGILSRIRKETFFQFKTNPESFIAETTRIIAEQKASVIIEHLSYDTLSETHDIDIFTNGQYKQNFSKAGEPLKKHIYDYAITDSRIERSFVKELDTSSEVVVYAKLPKGFAIPTPVGSYRPDWAITFKEGRVKHVYFVAETKGSMSSLELREIEKTKIKCARKFFEEINRKINPENVKYDVVNDFGKLMEIVGVK